MRPSTLAIAAVAALTSQQSAELSLGKRDASIAEQFSAVAGLAELNDGRVIVADRIEKIYAIADFKTGQRVRVGRNGPGPNEYQTPFGPIKWKGDTLLGYDPNNRRMLRMMQDGRIVSTIPFPQPRAGGVNAYSTPRAVDARGAVYWDAAIIEMQPVVKRSMKANIIRWLPGADTAEIAMQIADHGEFEHSFRFRPVPQSDAWVMSPDGRIGVLSAAEYRLRWYKDGNVVETGPLVPHAKVAVTGAERDAFRAKKALEPMSGAMVNGAGGATQAQMGIERAKAAWPDSLFPEQLPPFENAGVQRAPHGDIWVPRTMSARETAQRVDILDARGAFRAAVRLPARSKLVFLGAQWVYLIAVDDDGLQTLERYAYPTLR